MYRTKERSSMFNSFFKRENGKPERSSGSSFSSAVANMCQSTDLTWNSNILLVIGKLGRCSISDWIPCRCNFRLVQKLQCKPEVDCWLACASVCSSSKWFSLYRKQLEPRVPVSLFPLVVAGIIEETYDESHIRITTISLIMEILCCILNTYLGQGIIEIVLQKFQ